MFLLAKCFLEAWGTTAPKTSLSLTMYGFLALVPQASKHHLAKKPLRDPFEPIVSLSRSPGARVASLGPGEAPGGLPKTHGKPPGLTWADLVGPNMYLLLLGF